MTQENSKRLYEHYVKIGYKAAAENMLKKHPNLAAQEEKKEKSKKPK